MRYDRYITKDLRERARVKCKKSQQCQRRERSVNVMFCSVLFCSVFVLFCFVLFCFVLFY